MSVVWKETLRQAGEAVEYWKAQGSNGITSSSKDIKTLTLHVLSSAGFGKSYSFRETQEKKLSEASTDWRDALSTIIDNTILILILGPKLLARLTLLRKLDKIHKATIVFKNHMANMLREEKHLIRKGLSGNTNLMTSLIHASVDVSDSSPESLVSYSPLPQPSTNGLLPEEVYGNMFVFSFAGHDTTSHTLAFAMNLLAAHPHVQEWMAEELRFYLGSAPSTSWPYQDAYPKMKRCLAVLVSKQSNSPLSPLFIPINELASRSTKPSVSTAP